jgi:hypothetical protein
MVRNVLEQEALHEAMTVLSAPRVTGTGYGTRAREVVAVLESYRAPLERLWEQDRLAKGGA